MGQALSRARAMMRQSTTRGLYSRLNSRERLRASSSSNSAPVKSKRAKVESNKVFEFVLLRLDDEDDEELNSDSVHSDSWMLTDESTVLRGFVTLSSQDNEEAIRKALSDAIQMKYLAVASNDLVFLKANRRRITQPVNCHEYSFKQVKSLAGQGAIYLRLKHGFGFLLDNQGSDNSSLKDNDVSNHTERSMPISTLQPPQRPKTNFVCIDRFNILESAMEEFKDLQNPRLTLEVSFYGEQAHDAGGPRKEFFSALS